MTYSPRRPSDPRRIPEKEPAPKTAGDARQRRAGAVDHHIGPLLDGRSALPVQGPWGTEALQQLQRTVGNRAVVDLIRRQEAEEEESEGEVDEAGLDAKQSDQFVALMEQVSDEQLDEAAIELDQEAEAESEGPDVVIHRTTATTIRRVKQKSKTQISSDAVRIWPSPGGWRRTNRAKRDSWPIRVGSGSKPSTRRAGFASTPQFATRI